MMIMLIFIGIAFGNNDNNNRTPFEKKNRHVPKTQLYGCKDNGQFDHVWVHVWYKYLIFPNLLRAGTDKLASSFAGACDRKHAPGISRARQSNVVWSVVFFADFAHGGKYLA